MDGGIPLPPLNACLACYGTAFNVYRVYQLSQAWLLCYSSYRLAVRQKTKELFFYGYHVLKKWKHHGKSCMLLKIYYIHE